MMAEVIGILSQKHLKIKLLVLNLSVIAKTNCEAAWKSRMAIDKEAIRGFSETVNRHSTNQPPNFVLQRMLRKFKNNF